MASRLNRKPVAVYTAAVPGVAARPAYCETKRTLVGYAKPQSGVISSPGGSGYVLVTVPADPLTLQQEYIWVFSGPTSRLQPVYKNVQTCYPEVQFRAAIPAQLDPALNSGWNSGARSIEPLPDNGRFTCQVGVDTAVMLGLTARGFNSTYSGFSHAIVLRPSGYTIVEYGATVQTELVSPAGAGVEVRRENRVVTFYVGGVLVYTSGTPSAGEAYVGAMLRGLGDSLESPEIAAIVRSFVRVDARLPALRLAVSETGAFSAVDIPLPMLVCDARLRRLPTGAVVDVVMPRLVGLAADRPLALVDLTLPRVRIEAVLNRREYVPPQMVAVLPMLALSAQLRSGRLGEVDVVIPGLICAVADRPLVTLNATLPLRLAMTAVPAYMPTGEIDGLDSVAASDTSALDTALVLVAIDQLELATTASVVVVLELSTMDSVAVADAATFGQLVEMLAMERVSILSSTSTARAQAIQYAVNALSGAPTTYEGFDFTSFVTLGDETYGLRPDGLYLIGAGADDGAPIDAMVDFGTSDFSDSHVKRMETAYLGLRTDGQCYLRVRGDVGLERVYRVRGESNVRRSTLAKGVAARSWSLKLELVGASFAELDSLELLVGATQRRGFGDRTR